MTVTPHDADPRLLCQHVQLVARGAKEFEFVGYMTEAAQSVPVAMLNDEWLEMRVVAWRDGSRDCEYTAVSTELGGMPARDGADAADAHFVTDYDQAAIQRARLAPRDAD